MPESATVNPAGPDKWSQRSLLLRILDDQSQQWRQGAGVPVEEYLRRHPELANHSEALVDLICNEVVQRDRRGEEPDIEEYVRRFPHLAGALVSPVDLPPAAAQPTLPLASASVSASPVSAPPGYAILGELGKGGMGVVYKATQVALKRTVALKMIKSGVADAGELARFRTEAEAMARLAHPNIVQIHDVGEHNGQPFFSLEYVDGGTLKQRLTGTPWPARQAAVLVETLARAVHAAHERGVIHRDLKPANVLLPAGKFIPKVADFGLAKQLDQDVKQTQTGAIMGTPAYMAPEQASGQTRAIGPATDVYALGAILYELLTGRPPFQAASVLETLEQVRSQEPVPPRSMQPKIARDVETICLKCLQKDPARRYPTAEALAEELKRFLEGKPIQARPVGMAERFGRWCRRNPVVAGLTGAVALILVVGIIVTSVLAINMAHFASREQEEAANARAKEREAIDENKEARHNVYMTTMFVIADAWEKGDAASVQQLLETLVPKPGQEDLRGPEWHYFWKKVHGYTLSIGGESSRCESVAFLDRGRTLVTGGPGAVKLWDAETGKERATLAAEVGFTYEVRPAGEQAVILGRNGDSLIWWACSADKLQPLFQTQIDRDTVPVVWAVSPDAKVLAAAVGPEDATRKLIVWDAATGQERFRKDLRGTPLCFTPDARRLAVANMLSGTNNPLILFDAVTGEEATRIDNKFEVRAGAFSPDGKQLIVGSRGTDVITWDVGTRKVVSEVTLGTWPDAVALSPDGKTLVAGPGFGVAPIRVWDRASEKKFRDLWGHRETVRQMVIAPDNVTLAVACKDGTVKVWDLRPSAAQEAGAHTPLPDPRVLSLAFSPDGRTLATASADHTVKVWDVPTGKELALLQGHAGEVTSAVFLPDGLLVTGSADRTVRVWDTAVGRETASFRELAPVTSLACSPNGKTLAVTTRGAGVELRGLPAGGELPVLWGGRAVPNVHGVAFSSDSAMLAACDDKSVRVWDAATQRLRRIFKVNDVPRAVAFTPDGARLIAGGEGAKLTVWNLPTGEETSLPLPREFALGTPIRALGVSPDGTTLVAGRGAFRYSDVCRWDLKTMQSLPKLRLHEGADLTWVAYSPDGKLVAAAHPDGTVGLFTLGKEITPDRYLPGHANAVRAVARSADGTVVEARPDFTVRILDARSDKERAVLPGHAFPVTAVAVSREGNVVVTGSEDGVVRLWDRGGKARGVLRRHKHPICCLAVSPDGRTVASGDGKPDAQGEVILWDASTGEARATLKPQGYTVFSVAFSPDGKILACGTGGYYTNIHGMLALWDAETGAELGQLGQPLPTYVTAAHHAEGHAGKIVTLAFSPDGRLLASGSTQDGTVRLWDVAGRKLLAPLRGHGAGVAALAFSPDGGTLVSASADHTVRFWNVPRRQCRGVLPVREVTSLSFTPDGRELKASGLHGTAELYRPVPAGELRPYEEALAKREAAGTTGPDYQRVRMQFLVARKQEQAGDKVAAEQTRKRAEALAETVPGAERFKDPFEWGQGDAFALNTRANSLFDQGAVDQAITVWQEATRLYPHWATPWYNLGVALAKKGRIEQAMASYGKAIELHRDYPAAHGNLAHLLEQQKRLDEALAEYREAARSDPKDVRYHRYLAYLLEERKEWGEAAKAWQEVVRLQPDDAGAHVNLGHALFSGFDRKKAAEAFRAAIRLKPDYVLAHRNLAITLQEDRDWDGAIAAFRDVLRLQPGDLDAHAAISNLLGEQGKHDEAVAYARKTIDLAPKHHRPRHQLGEALARQGKFDAAIAAYREAIQLKPDEAPIHWSLAQAFEGKGNREEAIAAYRQVARLAPTSSRTRATLGRVLKENGKLDDAIAAWVDAIRVDPESPYASMAFDDIKEALKTKGDKDATVSVLQEVARANPKGITVRFDLVDALIEKGSRDEAVTVWGEAVGLTQEFMPAYAHQRLGRLLQRQGNLDEAIAAFMRAIRLERFTSSVDSVLKDLADALKQKGDKDLTVSVYQEVVRLQPRNLYAWFDLAESLADKGEWEEAVAAWNQAIPQVPEYRLGDAHGRLGRLLQRQGNLDEAIAAFVNAFRLEVAYGRLGQVRKDLADALKQKGDKDLAVSVYREVVQLRPKEVSLRFDLVDALLAKEKWEEALTEGKQAAEAFPKSSDIRRRIGRALEGQGKLDEAITAFREAVRLTREDLPLIDSSSFTALRKALEKKNDPDLTLTALEEVVRWKPKDVDGRYWYADALRKESRWDDAVAQCKEAIRLKPEWVYGYLLQTTVLEQKKNYEGAFAVARDAVAVFEKFHAAGPNKPGVKEDLSRANYSLARLYANCLDEKYRDPTKALTFARKATELNPSGSAGWVVLGMAHYRAGDLSAARTALEKGLELTKDGDSHAWFFLAMTRWRLGDRGAARGLFDKAVKRTEEKFPDDVKGHQFHAEAARLLGLPEQGK